VYGFSVSDTPVPVVPPPTLAERAKGLSERMLVQLCGAFLEDPATPPDLFREAVDVLRKQVGHKTSTRVQRGAADILLKHATRVVALSQVEEKQPGATAIIINIQPPPAAPAPRVVDVKPATNGHEGNGNGH